MINTATEKNRSTTSADLWRMPRVEEATGLKQSEIYNRISDGRFPRPVKLGARASAWVSTEVQAWIAERIAGRDEGQAA